MEQQADPLAQCIALTTQGAEAEMAAMELDRQGDKVQEAIASYRQAVEILQQAATACPEGHVDRPVLERHCREVVDRLTYLQDVLRTGAAAELPLETHIGSVELTMGSPSEQAATEGPSGMRVLGAVAAIGGVAGMMIRGPIVGIACAAGAAYTATRSDKAGETARSIGQAGVSAADKAKSINEKYEITDKAKVAGVATVAKAQDLGGKTLAKAQDLDAQYGISEKAKTASATTAAKAHDLSSATVAKTRDFAGATVAKAEDLDAQYQIKENVKKTADTVGKGLATGFAVVSGLLQARMAGRPSNGTPAPSSTGGAAQSSISDGVQAPVTDNSPADSSAIHADAQ